MNTTKETVDFYSLLKKESGFKVENEGAALNLIQKAFDKLKVDLIKVNDPELIKPKDKIDIGSELKEVFETGNKADTIESGWKRWNEFIERHLKKYPSLKSYLAERYKLYFTFYQYDYRMRNMVYTTNWIERLNRDYKRTTRMRGALPNAEAAILLMAQVALSRKAFDRKIPKLNATPR